MKRVSVKFPCRQCHAWAFLLLFTAFWSLKTLHIFVLHPAEKTVHPVCDAAHDPNLAHIHDENWEKESCELCAFVVSVQASFSLPVFSIFSCKPPQTSLPACYEAPPSPKAVADTSLRRGPPAA